jgi:hypothetical protein
MDADEKFYEEAKAKGRKMERYYDMNIKFLSTDHLDTVEKIVLAGTYLGLPEDTKFQDVIDSITAWAVDEIVTIINKNALQDALDQAYLEIERFKMRTENEE